MPTLALSFYHNDDYYVQNIDIEMQNFIGEDNTPEYIVSRDILYADDKILVGLSRDQMQYYIDTVVRYARN